MKKILFAIAFLGFVGSAVAQISTGDPVSKKIRTGNRPESGDWGIYMGMSVDEFNDLFSGAKVAGLPLVNLKYFASDKLEFRLGIQAWGKETAANGEMFKTADFEGETQKYSTLTNNMDWKLQPGVSYHFANINLLDVYAGAYIPLGWSANSTSTKAGDYINGKSSGYFNLGVGAFIGLQAFIADLPIALGLEYGIRASWKIGDKSILNTVTSAGTEPKTYKYYTIEGAESGNFKSLGAGSSMIGQELRITFAYYFKSK